MDLLKNLSLLFFMLYTLSACHTGTNFDPDFRVSEVKPYSEMVCSINDFGVVSERGEFISCASSEFRRMACMTESKIKELADLLTRAEIPDNQRKKLLKEFHSAIWWEDNQP